MSKTGDISAFFGKRSIASAFELTDALNVIQFIGTDTGATYRAINHWESEGLIPDRREEGQRWRRFSFVDFVWIKMIDQLRALGINLETIKRIKEMVLEPSVIADIWDMVVTMGDWRDLANPERNKEEYAAYEEMFAKVFAEPKEGEVPETFTFLQLLIANAITKRCPIRILVFVEGDFLWIEEHPEFVMPPEFIEKMSYEPYISVSITGILRQFLSSELAFERIESLKLLGENETFLLKAVLSGEYDSIKVKFKNKKLDSLELKKTQETTKKIVEVLTEAEYQEISLVQHKGRITKFENTVKHRFEHQ
jgi:DNA-binding transcriptional MerR regulator